MRKTGILFIALSLCTAVSAQDVYSSMNLGENLYYGTARTMGMGNAVTAVGGELGSLIINPAGSAVSSCSQVSVTPGVTISSTSAAYAPTFDILSGLTDADFTGSATDSKTRFVFPNGGFILNFETGYESGLHAITVGFVANVTNSYVNSWRVGALNPGVTCATGYLASISDGTAYSDYIASGAYDNYDLGFYAVNAVRSLAAQPYSLLDKTYMGASEIEKTTGDGETYLDPCGNLNQMSNVYSYGNKTDLAFNMGFDLGRTLYLGFNIGIPILTYNYTENYSESLAEQSESTDFDSYYSSYNLSRSGTGIYGKFGVIWLPVSGLRLGLAAQTPTSMSISEQYTLSGQTYFTGGQESGQDSGLRYNNYKLITPYRINAGLAYTFGSAAMVSADYEMADFSVSKYKTTSNNEGVFTYENTVNNLFLGVQHNFRAGIEIKPSQSFAVRLGYGLLTSSMYYYANSRYGSLTGDIYASDFNYYDYQSGRLQLGQKTLVPEFKHSFSGGLGYSSKGSFFADIALRYTLYPPQNFMVYGDYAYYNGVLMAPSPTVRSRRGLWDVVATIGWRF